MKACKSDVGKEWECGKIGDAVRSQHSNFVIQLEIMYEVYTGRE